MDKYKMNYFLGLSLAVVALLLGQVGDVFGGPPGLRGAPPGPRGMATGVQSCQTVNGSADLKEGNPSGKSQYWINGMPSVSRSCSYTLELCSVGERKEIGAKVFMTGSTGRKYQSSDNIVNCNSGWSRFFGGKVAGAKEIIAAVRSGHTLNVRFVGISRGGLLR